MSIHISHLQKQLEPIVYTFVVVVAAYFGGDVVYTFVNNGNDSVVEKADAICDAWN